jgi:hypothetical protein
MCQTDALPKLLIRLLGSKCVHFDAPRRQLDAKLRNCSILLELKFRPERVCEYIQQLSAVNLAVLFFIWQIIAPIDVVPREKSVSTCCQTFARNTSSRQPNP